MALLFNKADHEYFLHGAQVPSVTGILHAAGLIRLDGIPPHILEAARQRGTAVHQACHYLNENDLDRASVDPAYQGYLDAWERYCDEKRLRIDLCEYRLASPRRGVAGTLDVLGLVDEPGIESEDGVLIDIATGDPRTVAKHLQTGGYLGLAYEWKAHDPRLAAVLDRYRRVHRCAVRLRKNGTFQVSNYTDPRDTSRFYVLTEAWHIRQSEGVVMRADDLAA